MALFSYQSHVTVFFYYARDIPSHKQKFAGKNLPVEKFAILKAERYIKDARLPLCVLVSLLFVYII